MGAGAEKMETQLERHEHGWYWAKWNERFQCDYEDEEGDSCPAVIRMETVIKLIPVDDKHLAGMIEGLD